VAEILTAEDPEDAETWKRFRLLLSVLGVLGGE
jgi:hypothetical protein